MDHVVAQLVMNTSAFGREDVPLLSSSLLLLGQALSDSPQGPSGAGGHPLAASCPPEEHTQSVTLSVVGPGTST